MIRAPVRPTSRLEPPPSDFAPSSDFADDPTDVPAGYGGLLGIEAERKGNLYIEARVRRRRAGTVEGS